MLGRAFVLPDRFTSAPTMTNSKTITRALRAIRSLKPGECIGVVLYDSTPNHPTTMKNTVRAVIDRRVGDDVFSLRLENKAEYDWVSFSYTGDAETYSHTVPFSGIRPILGYYLVLAQDTQDADEEDAREARRHAFTFSECGPLYDSGTKLGEDGFPSIAMRVRIDPAQDSARVVIEYATHNDPDHWEPYDLGLSTSTGPSLFDVVVPGHEATKVAKFFSSLIETEADELKEEGKHEAERLGITPYLLEAQWLAVAARNRARKPMEAGK